MTRGNGPVVEAEPKRPLMRLAGWVLILLTPLVFFAMVEGLVRLVDWQPGSGPAAAVPAWLDAGILEKESDWIRILAENPGTVEDYYSTYIWDRYLFYRLRPGLDIPMTDITAPAAVRDRTGWNFHTNARGFNTPIVDWEREEGIFRVVALGDSSTFGWGVDTEASYPRLLEAMLRQKYPEGLFEVLNLGVCGYTSLQGLVLMKKEAMIYRPDVLLISYGSNDFSLVPEAFDMAYERNIGWSGALQALLNKSRAYQAWAVLLRGAVATGSPGSQKHNENHVLNIGPEKGRLNLMEMAYLAREKGAEPVFVTNCVRGHLGEPIRLAASITKAPVLDTEDLLHKASESAIGGTSPWPDKSPWETAIGLYGHLLVEEFPWISYYLTDHCHPNDSGHRLIAESLLAIVEQTAAFHEYMKERDSVVADGPGM